jgi:hypothetical protein
VYLKGQKYLYGLSQADGRWPLPLAMGKPARHQSHSGKFATLSGSQAYPVAYHATSMDVVFS